MRRKYSLDLLKLNTQIEDWANFTRAEYDSCRTIKHLDVELSILI